MKPLIQTSVLALALLVAGPTTRTASAQLDPVARLAAHVRQMEAARAPVSFQKVPWLPSARLQRMVPEHEQMLSAFLDVCDGMEGGEAHDAAVEAVRRDLRRLPRLRGMQLDDFVSGHAARVRQLIRIHEAVTAG